MAHNSWLAALKKWNTGKAKYTIPKKGTADYDAVKKIQNKSKCTTKEQIGLKGKSTK